MISVHGEGLVKDVREVYLPQVEESLRQIAGMLHTCEQEALALHGEGPNPILSPFSLGSIARDCAGRTADMLNDMQVLKDNLYRLQSAFMNKKEQLRIAEEKTNARRNEGDTTTPPSPPADGAADGARAPASSVSTPPSGLCSLGIRKS